jgi:hypothetical protein
MSFAVNSKLQVAKNFVTTKFFVKNFVTTKFFTKNFVVTKFFAT